MLPPTLTSTLWSNPRIPIALPATFSSTPCNVHIPSMLPAIACAASLYAWTIEASGLFGQSRHGETVNGWLVSSGVCSESSTSRRNVPSFRSAFLIKGLAVPIVAAIVVARPIAGASQLPRPSMSATTQIRPPARSEVT